ASPGPERVRCSSPGREPCPAPGAEHETVAGASPVRVGGPHRLARRSPIGLVPLPPPPETRTQYLESTGLWPGARWAGLHGEKYPGRGPRVELPMAGRRCSPRAIGAVCSEHVLEQVEPGQIGALVMDGVLTQIGEAAADVELAGGGVLDISVQPYRAAASLACRAQRGVDEEPRDPAPLEAGQNPEGMDDQHLPRCGVVRPGGLLVALRALVVEHHDPGDLLAGAGRLLCGERQVQGPGLGPGPHFLGGRVV